MSANLLFDSSNAQLLPAFQSTAVGLKEKDHTVVLQQNIVDGTDNTTVITGNVTNNPQSLRGIDLAVGGSVAATNTYNAADRIGSVELQHGGLAASGVASYNIECPAQFTANHCLVQVVDANNTNGVPYVYTKRKVGAGNTFEIVLANLGGAALTEDIQIVYEFY